jgi:predicted nucleic acid-binding protein
VILVDTSALLALLEQSDRSHHDATRWLRTADPAELGTHNYVALETAALVQRRLGDRALRDLMTSWLATLDVWWVTPEIHDAAVGALLAGGSRRTSLVDHVSFEVMRREGIGTAFAFDGDFERVGFQVVP